MGRYAAIALIGYVGCYAPSVPLGGACDEQCPGAQVCVGHVCRDPDDLPVGDLDGDGVLDDVDNCPATPNVDQHDEDHDGLGDACDPCPHLAGDAGDQDGDGVGDACDPEPAIPHQHFKFFETFVGVRPEWESIDPTLVTDDRLSVSSKAFARLGVSNGELRIDAGGTITSLASVPDDHQIAIEFGHDVNNNRFHYGEFFDSNANDGNVQITEFDGMTFVTLANTPYGTIQPGGWSMRIDESASAHRIQLVGRIADVPYPALDMAAPDLTTGSFIQFDLVNLVMTVDYVVVIETALQ